MSEISRKNDFVSSRDLPIYYRESLRTYQRSMRKISAMQRNIVKLMGNSYPSETDTGHLLLEDGPPGFCYRRNGDPKMPPALSLSNSKKVILNVDGKEGLLPTPAQSVIGESPMLNAILSKPKILNLLCELRNTSTLMNNRKEFEKFALNLKNHPNSELPHKDSAKEYLHAYRIGLIKQFLLALKSEVDNALKDEDTVIVLKENSKPIEAHQKMTIAQWNETQQEKRDALQRLEEEKAKVQAHKEAVEKAKAIALEIEMEAATKVEPTEEDILHRKLKAYSVMPTLYSNRNIGFEKYRHPPDNEIPQIPVVPNFISQEDEKPKLVASNFSRVTNASVKQKRKEDFTDYVRGLIADVKGVCEMGKTVKGLKRKKPIVNERVANSLVRLLGKESLFKSLNVDDFVFLDCVGGKRSLEKRMAKKLNLSNNPRPGGFTFIVPSRTDVQEETDYELEERMNETWDKVMGISTSAAATVSSRPDSGESLQGSSKSTLECRKCCKKSMNRLCCLACKTKIKQKCEGMQAINKNAKVLKSWKFSGKMVPSNVPSYLKAKIQSSHQSRHFLQSVPTATHKNYSHKFKRIEHLSQKTITELKSLDPKAQLDSKEIKSILSKKGAMKVSSKKVDFSSVAKSKESKKSLRKASPGKPRSRVAFSSRPNPPTEIPSLIQYSDIETNLSLKKWSLQVSKIDILQFIHELDTHVLSKKRYSFEKKFFQSENSQNNITKDHNTL